MQSQGSEEQARGGRPASNERSNELAELALAVYLEELAAQKKVLFVGDPSSAAPERLARGARSVEIVSPRSRVRGTRRGGRVAARRWPSAEEQGRWDLVIIPDLPAAGLADEVHLAEIRGWLAPGGVLVTGTPDPEGPAGHPSALSYEALFDLLDGGFEHVRMIGQAPFAGFSVVDFAPSGELGVTFDGSLLEGGERAQRYYALSGERDVVVDAYAVVQVPSSAALREAPARERLREQQDALDAANVHAEELERELETARAEIAATKASLGREQERAAERAARERASLEAELVAARAELDAQRAALEAARASSGGEDEHEYAALEASLEERGRELIELRAEVARRGTLARDLIEELREVRGAPAITVARVAPERPTERVPEPPRLSDTRALDAAIERAIVAETARAALEFRLDEISGQLALADRSASQEIDGLKRLEAQLRGTIRGLHARVAELAEQHQLTQARLALAEDDRAAAEARNRRLVRELAEAREQVELEIARERMAAREQPSAGDDALARLTALEKSAAIRESELLGELARAREEAAALASRQQAGRGEAQAASVALVHLEQQVEGMRAGYEARVRELVSELDGLSRQAESALAQAGELRSQLGSREALEAELRGELEGARRRLADREAAVEGLRAEAVRGAADTGALEVRDREIAQRRDESVALRARIEELESARRAPATVAYARDADTEVRLTATIGARDQLVARLQRELADASERRHALERRLDEQATKLAQSREALESMRAVSDVRGLESGRELEELNERVERLERERREALDGLEEARAILAQLAGELPERRPGAESDGPSARHLRERVARLDAEAADREVLLRSLTAQLQERDDRIRALERMRTAGEGGEEPGAMRQRLFEMEERVARLTDELEHERAARHRENPPS